MTSEDDLDAAAIMGGLYGDGIIGLKGAFAPEWADVMHADTRLVIYRQLWFTKHRREARFRGLHRRKSG